MARSSLFRLYIPRRFAHDHHLPCPKHITSSSRPFPVTVLHVRLDDKHDDEHSSLSTVATIRPCSSTQNISWSGGRPRPFHLSCRLDHIVPTDDVVLSMKLPHRVQITQNISFAVPLKFELLPAALPPPPQAVRAPSADSYAAFPPRSWPSHRVPTGLGDSPLCPLCSLWSDLEAALPAVRSSLSLFVQRPPPSPIPGSAKPVLSPMRNVRSFGCKSSVVPC